MKIYDRKNNRIAVFEEKATDKFWDKHWMTEDIKNEIKSGKNNILIKKITNKFLQKGSMVLEGGCGNGRFVYGLTCCATYVMI